MTKLIITLPITTISTTITSMTITTIMTLRNNDNNNNDNINNYDKTTIITTIMTLRNKDLSVSPMAWEETILATLDAFLALLMCVRILRYLSVFSILRIGSYLNSMLRAQTSVPRSDSSTTF